MCATARAKAVTMRFKFRLPFRFEREFDQSLLTAVDHWQDGKRSPFCCTRLGNPYSSHWHGGLVAPIVGMNGGRHGQSLFGAEGFDAIDARGMPALVLFGYPAHGQQPCRFRFHQSL